jgi:hypothetical protein
MVDSLVAIENKIAFVKQEPPLGGVNTLFYFF